MAALGSQVELAARTAGNSNAVGGYGNQYLSICSSILAGRNLPGREAWQAIVHRVAKGWTLLKYITGIGIRLCLEAALPHNS